MVNKEKYADEILNIACSRFGFAVSKRTGKPCYCCDIDCKNQCLLYEEDDGVMLCLKNVYAKVTNSFIAAYFRECDFGEFIFFTREEAEKKLEESEI